MKLSFNHSFHHKVLSGALLAVITALVFSSISQAHASLLRSDPADGSVLPTSPGEIQLWFDEPVSPRFSSAQLFDADSQPVEINGIRGDVSDPTSIILELPQLPEGVFSLLWKTLSEVDGHTNQGLLVFGVGEQADLGTATITAAADQPPAPQEVILRWANFMLIALVVGSLAMIQLVIYPSLSSAGAEPQISSGLRSASRRMLALTAWAVVLCIFVGMGMLVWQVITLKANLPADATYASVTWQTLSGTRWGMVWSIRQVTFIILGLLLFAPLRRSSHSKNFPLPGVYRIFIDLFAVALILLQALSSHASGLIEDTAIAITTDALHLLAACLWVGGLLSLAIGILPLLRQPGIDKSRLLRAGWRPFSLVAAFSVGILITTGLYNTARQVASPDGLLTTTYGQSLMVKIGLVICAGVFGLINSMLLHSSLASPLARILKRPLGWTPLPTRSLPVLIMAEGFIGLMVLLTTGLITASPAPRDPSFTTAEENAVSSLSQSVDDLVITLNTKPNRPGQNVFTVFARSTRRPFPAEIARVLLRFTYLDQDLGKTSATADEIEAGRYLLSGNYLSLPGDWEIEVVVRRLGMQDSVASFNWTVIPPGDPRLTVFSKFPWSPYLILAAASLLLLIILIACVIFLRRNRSLDPDSRPDQLRTFAYEHIDETA